MGEVIAFPVRRTAALHSLPLESVRQSSEPPAAQHFAGPGRPRATLTRWTPTSRASPSPEHLADPRSAANHPREPLWREVTGAVLRDERRPPAAHPG